ncbi:MAG: LPXTG cell wall anchor domain-containing protein [Oscillospiraceae bacterium]|nr:LPXTG cell wall anchor domain-containing protein [Oscillospiraceae bacterium]
MKKIVTLGIVLALITAVSVTALAAGVDDVMASLESLAAQYPEAAKYVEDAKAWLAEGANAELVNSESNAASIVGEINAATTAAGGITKISDLSATQRQAIVSNITNAANTAGLKVSVNAASAQITITDPNGKTVISYSDPIKQTGFGADMIGFIAIGVLFAVVLLFVLKGKKKQLSAA